MTLEQRKQTALQARENGYNCAQAVLLAFADKVSPDKDTLMALSAPLGAGVACGEICGVANAIAIITGLILNNPAPDGKIKGMAAVKPILNQFIAKHGGIRCKELKAPDAKIPCNDLILNGIEILHDNLPE